MDIQYHKRQIEPLFKRYLKSFPVIAVSGARQTGKTTLIRHLLKDYDFVSFDILDSRNAAVTDPRGFVDSLRDKTIIDEMQYAPEILSYIKYRVDNDRHKNGNFILTGSQQFLMMKGLTETLAGRIGIMDLYPFSAKEAIPAKINTQELFKKFAVIGSYPQPLLARRTDTELWYQTYRRIYTERDAAALFKIGSISEFQVFFKLLAMRTAQPLNMSAISSEAGVSVVTIKKWISILEASGLIRLLKPYHSNIKKRLVKAPKLYFVDTAFACRLCGIKNEQMLSETPMAGAFFENFCVMEALKQNENMFAGAELMYLRTGAGLEVDLVVERSGKYSLFEIKASKSVPKGAGNNMKTAVDTVFPKNSVQSCYVVTMNDETGAVSGDVKYCGLETLLENISE